MKFHTKIFISLILSSLGCSYQVYYISQQFFDYETATKVSIASQTNSFVPTLVLCTGFTNFLPLGVDETQFKNTASFNEWFESTPAIETVIDSGSYFFNASTWWLPFNNKGFNSLFVVKKMFRRLEVCYSMSFRKPHNYNYRAITSSSKVPQLVSFSFSHNFLVRHTPFVFYVHSFDSSFHGIGNSLAAISLSPKNQCEVFLTFTEYENHLLSAPYDSDCFDYRPVFKNEKHCYDVCHLDLSLRTHKWIPISVIKDSLLKEKTFFQSDRHTTQSPAIILRENKLLRQIKQNCTSKCSKTQCDRNDFVPILIHTIEGDQLEVNMQASPEPLFKTIFEPKIFMIDFVTYILSCIGFWYGISCFSSVGRIFKTLNGSRNRRSNDIKRKQMKTTTHSLVKFDPKLFGIVKSLEQRMKKLEVDVRKLNP